jgi:hypothetical protein
VPSSGKSSWFLAFSFSAFRYFFTLQSCSSILACLGNRCLGTRDETRGADSWDPGLEPSVISNARKWRVLFILLILVRLWWWFIVATTIIRASDYPKSIAGLGVYLSQKVHTLRKPTLP